MKQRLCLPDPFRVVIDVCGEVEEATNLEL